MPKVIAMVLGILLGVTSMGEAAAKGMKGWQSPVEKARVKAIVAKVDAKVAKGPFRDAWHSLKGYQTPDWYRDAKFGIFIHWGLYSVPAYNNEWYSRLMYQEGTDEFKHHVATYGPQKDFGYKDFIPRLTAERFDPDHWADVFKRAGARFVVPVAEHHDGFAMYDSKLTRWSAAKMGPKRDLIGDLARSVRAKGLVFGLSTHRAEHWWFMNGGMKFPSDVQDPRFADFYGPAEPDGTPPSKEFLANWLARSVELIDRYHPQVMGDFDWWIGEQPAFDPYLRKLKAYYYNQAALRKEGVVLTAKERTFVPGTSVEDVEKGQWTGINPVPWQTDTSVSWRSWAYLENDQLKDVGYLVRYLINTVSKNGNLLLNIGPKADGTIPEGVEKTLLGIGDWLAVNGEAIYGTRPWTTYGEGPTQEKGGKFQETGVVYREGDVRYTRKGDTLYVISMVPPQKSLRLEALGKAASPFLEVVSAERVGDPSPLPFERDKKALVLRCPKAAGDLPVVYKLRLSGSKMGRSRVTPSGMKVEVSAEVQHYGPRALPTTVALVVDGKTVSEAPVSVPAMSAAESVHRFAPERPGVYRLALRGLGEETEGATVTLPRLDLSGTWSFHKGNDPSWSDPGLSEKGWEKVHLPDNWENHSRYTEDNVYGWYRLKLVVPVEWKGHDLQLPVGTIDDADVTFFNGKEVGRTGGFPPKFKCAWNEERHYVVPAKLVRFGEENVIAVQVFDATGNGGIYGGPLGPLEATQKP